jgi:hypothetical protein
VVRNGTEPPVVEEQRQPNPMPRVEEQRNGNPTYIPPVPNESRDQRQPPQIREQRNGDTTAPDYERYYGRSGYRPPTYRQAPAPVAPVRPPVAVKPERIASYRGTQVEGQVVRNDNAPRPNVQLRFVNQNRNGPQYPVTANSAGRFRITLTSGSWLVYMRGADGRETLHSRIDVRGETARRVTLVTR